MDLGLVFLLFQLHVPVSMLAFVLPSMPILGIVKHPTKTLLVLTQHSYTDVQSRRYRDHPCLGWLNLS